jgi:hypothetical protein
MMANILNVHVFEHLLSKFAKSQFANYLSYLLC